ncbi:MAG TPA: UvrD-helicase domain-containing protein [Thermoanaerobaculia bacterium]|nr:UvrD-helicase domain-containing protein [Thermoanaerobaculia bacterium]
MKPVQVISASAGSGKTSRLARHLAEEIREGRVRPEAVVAVTFTVKAAAELARRVREELLRYGKVDEARRLGAARIGTVHSVCGRLLSDFAFDLGLSPDLTVLDQESAAAALKRSLSSVVEREDEESLSELQSLFADLDLEEAARRIQEAARSNGVDAATLYASGEASVAELTKLLDGCGREIDGALWDAALVAALDTFLASVDLDLDTTKATKDARARVRSALAALRGTRRPAWQVFAGLANLETGKKSREHAAPVQALAADHDRHPLFRSDLARATRLAFSLAARSLSAYADYKRERGVVDFADQEALALRLLERPAVREQLEAEIDLVLVDEFQDTSPLQLALFLSLARLAKSAWVGDQKQAIYGFRGADPALMDAAIESLLGGDEPETLPKSWRSRPALVHVASELFVGAFGRQGLPEARVRLAPGEPDEPPGLGPVVERWALGSKNKAGDAAETAARVRALIEDPETRVRDRATGEVRRPRPGDVAVLCRLNEDCAEIAAALAAEGLESTLPRAEAARSLEGLLLVAGLRLWADSHDSLAAATLARLVERADDPDAWLAETLGAPGAEAFGGLLSVSRVRAAREAAPLLGPEAAFDAVLDALDLRELCLAWGAAASRLASLEELRAAAVAFTGRALAEGRPATVLGFLDSLDEAVKPEQRPESPDAVVVSTLHGAKGLEWPIVVLDLHPDTREASAFEVNVLSEAPIDLDRPLAGRRIVFWPGPYTGRTSRTRIHGLLDSSERKRLLAERADRESLRLLYVGFTRARDRVVLSARAGTLTDSLFRHLGAAVDDDGPIAAIGGTRVETFRRPAPPPLAARPARAAGAAPVPAGPREHPPAFVSASKVEEPGTAGEPISIGPRLPLRSGTDMQLLGVALHGFLAGDRPSLPSPERLALAEGLIARWGVAGALLPESFLDASDALAAFVASRWPAAAWHRELPIRRRLPDGSVLSGTADLVLETAEGLVVVDHKSYPGSTAEALARAATHAGQVGAYAETVAEAWGKPVLGTFIHLPIGGIVVPVS